MDVAVESTTGLERRMTVQLPEDDIAAQVDERLRDMVRSARIPGFRPGKVPLKVIVKRYGKQVRGEVVGELVQSSFYDAITRENLRPAGGPVIDPLQAEPGEGLSYTAVFEVYPQLDIAAVEGLEIMRPTSQVGEEDIEKMLDTLRRQRRTWEEVERPAATGDRVTINFEGSIDGEPFEGGKAEDFPLTIGESSMIDGFEDGVAGMTAGEDKTLELTFPDEYPAEALAGKATSFAVHAQKVEEPKLPEIDEDFIKSFGVSAGTMEEFRAEIRQNLERELADALRGRTKEEVMDRLLESNTVELPNALVQEEMQRLLDSRLQELKQQGYDADSLGLTAEMFDEPARRRVGLGLVLAEIIRTHALSPDQEKVRAAVDGIASTFEEPQQVVSWYYGDRTRLAEIESSVLEEQVVELLLDKAQVTDKSMTFDELLNPSQTGAEA